MRDSKYKKELDHLLYYKRIEPIEIRKCSNYNDENEVLFSPLSCFKILSVQKEISELKFEY